MQAFDHGGEGKSAIKGICLTAAFVLLASPLQALESDEAKATVVVTFGTFL
jgi:hypothetical protein